MEKIIFSKNSAKFCNSGRSVRTRALEWDLIRAILTREDKKIHWLDGFLVFHTWRDKEQKTDYPGQFMVIANRATKKLRRIRFGAEINSIQHSGGDWVLEFRSPRRYETNIEEATMLLKKSQHRFALGDNSGWQFVTEATQKWAEPRILCQTIIHAQRLPDGLETYKDELGNIKALIEDYRNDLVRAILKVAEKASTEKQGLSFKTQKVCETLVRWMVEIADTNEVLAILGDKVVCTPRIEDDETRLFVRLAIALAEYTEVAHKQAYDRIGSERVVMPDENDYDKADLLEKLSTCGFVLKIRERVEDYFEQIDYLKIESDHVQIHLKPAIFLFASRHKDTLESCGNVEGLFHQFLRRYVRAERIGAGLGSEIFNASDKDAVEKRKALETLLFSVAGESQLVKGVVQEAASILRNGDAKEDAFPKRPEFSYLRPVEVALRIEAPENWQGYRQEVISGEVFLPYEDAEVAEILEKHKQIVGRKGLKKSVKEFVTHQDRGLLLITGLPGVGKTALMANLAHELAPLASGGAIVFFPFCRESARCSLLVCLQSLYVSLAKKSGLFVDRPSSDIDVLAHQFSGLLQTVATERQATAQIRLDGDDKHEQSLGIDRRGSERTDHALNIILVDAVDEAKDPSSFLTLVPFPVSEFRRFHVL